MSQAKVQGSERSQSSNVAEDHSGLLREVSELKETIRLDKSKTLDDDSEFVLLMAKLLSVKYLCISEYYMSERGRNFSSFSNYEHEVPEDTERSSRKNVAF